MGPIGVAQTYLPHPYPVEPFGPVRRTGPSTPEGEGLCGTHAYAHRRPSAGWGLSRLSISPDTRDGTSPRWGDGGFC